MRAVLAVSLILRLWEKTIFRADIRTSFLHALCASWSCSSSSSTVICLGSTFHLTCQEFCCYLLSCSLHSRMASDLIAFDSMFLLFFFFCGGIKFRSLQVSIIYFWNDIYTLTQKTYASWLHIMEKKVTINLQHGVWRTIEHEFHGTARSGAVIYVFSYDGRIVVF